MRSKVSVGAMVIATALLLAAAPAAYADIEVTGVLSTGSHTISIDSVQFIGDSTHLFSTPGWGGDTMLVDTFLFPSMFGPPQVVMLMGTLNGSPLLFPLAAPESDSWYVIYSMPQEARVKFTWLAGGVDGRDGPGPGRAGLTVGPSIVAAGATIRAERVAGASCVFDLFDAAGNRVRTLRSQVSPSGVAAATWNGTDEQGRNLPEGIYYCCLDGAAGPSVRKLVLTR